MTISGRNFPSVLKIFIYGVVKIISIKDVEMHKTLKTKAAAEDNGIFSYENKNIIVKISGYNEAKNAFLLCISEQASISSKLI